FEEMSIVQNELEVLEKERQGLLDTKTLKEFLKLVSDLVHRYLRYANRNPQYSSLNLYGLDENPINPDIEWNDSIAKTLVQSLGDYGNKKTLKRKYNSLKKAQEQIQQELTNPETLELFFQARKSEKQIITKKALLSTNNLLKEIAQKERDLDATNQEIEKIKQRTAEIQEKEEVLRNKFCEILKKF
ncbi:MAG: hypothetical protein ACFFBD_21765, partial [Candidatus Hodarchaeota archaeon]